MEKIISMILLATLVFVFSDGVHGKAKDGETLSEIDRKLKALNKPAVKSIMSEDGDIIDCVDIYKQLSLDHPVLKNHTLQLRPSIDLPTEKVDKVNNSNRPVVIQTWQKNGTCPKGTVAIRRIRKEDLLRAASLEHFGRKPYTAKRKEASNKSKFINLNNTKLSNNDLEMPNHSYAVLLTVGYNYIGAQADINVWNPVVDLGDDYTTAQIWLNGGPGDRVESVESGWMVNPKLYGDRRTRFFAYWTADGYGKTGCFDLTCTGFVQTSSQVALGSAIDPISSTLGPQYQITVGLNLDPKSGNWWLQINNVIVGYWPASLFGYLKHSAILVKWGGQVYSQAVKKTPHTRTAMGSGEMANTLMGNACFMKNIRIIDYSLQSKYPEWVGTWGDEYYCYNVYNDLRDYPADGPVFFFGGQGGRNLYCQ
ncbi:uncharacterized protein LOC123195256 [Mangifera indica]|uniref:uncharacterized protein LOC123195256 n=1 Tax=Mangifera indica TaxID=29780 RepID=UPI001CF99E27|nr:uncharacterized protein LOC123195256 [Mangifera indica]